MFRVRNISSLILTDKSKFEKQGFPPAVQKSKRLTITLALKGRAYSIRALLRVCRSYVDIFGGAIAFAVVINAILNRAIDALDVLFALALLVSHNPSLSFSFSKFPARRLRGGRVRFGFFADSIIIPTTRSNYFAFTR